jgi:FMN phosphatase YigB (HAD superfamily)
MSVDVLALDAMGVIYEAGDDVAELLVPFVKEHRGLSDPDAIHSTYLQASVGRLSATEFWTAIGLSEGLEDKYLSRHRLRADVDACLKRSEASFREVCCISNDVSEWSLKLRIRHSLVPRISNWYISGDLGHRKPDVAIYRAALDRLGVSATQVLFVDDRPRNLDAASTLGMQTLWLSDADDPNVSHRRIATLAAI